MKIAIDVRAVSCQPAGIGEYIRGMLSGLQRDTQNEYFLLSQEKVKISEVPPRSQLVILPVPSFLWHVAVWVFCLRNKVDVFHSPHSLVTPMLLGKRAILALHDLTAITHPQFHARKVRLLYCLFLRICLMRVGKILVPSEATKETLSQQSSEGVMRKVTKLPLAAGAGACRWNPDLKRPYILYIGTLEPRKNLARLLDALSILRSEHPEIILYIAGKLGWGMEFLKRYQASLGLGDSCRFLGYVDAKRKEELYCRASVFVYPSLSEGFGIPVLEAMKRGVPVVSSDVSSIPEIVGSAGLLVDPYDQEALAEALDRVLSNQDFAKELSIRSREQAQKYSWDSYGNTLLEVYENVDK